ncbi:cytochrome c [Mucilaginibacter sp. 14171R-50]|uniref:c-type cytochrome n=1 Tax=Mucilaginibacter sp. 14171R-50 TaxID=2703789 RepID=UPI00138BBBAE|nr:c-type cytochrome [Mucilaginibacter sp. 14171R-50]QHS55855.1 cytochrome c [Mucilaginibacter sp. 14171R-50]
MKSALIILALSFIATFSNAQKKVLPVTNVTTGKEIYAKHCMTCHQVDGVGAQNMIPPLIKTDYVLGDKKRLIKIILNGLKGDLDVNGDMYSGEMPSQALLKDDEIAAALTYVRKSFGNSASAVTIKDVRRVRAANKTISK